MNILLVSKEKEWSLTPKYLVHFKIQLMGDYNIW